ncbi:hypothetical protein P280DRAFT_467943 [Massarina eburnea CBS 473.64]|uniref:Uncharacterized protein n=1 Tax=Massarina eburnea CBS 473.64 TaxID=1395130 RepID=A0A6A6S5U1_9PLEO|nr:hypothetical protein P280DRAFT_467943 [Massarina eburnea CBS 473.64]
MEQPGLPPSQRGSHPPHRETSPQPSHRSVSSFTQQFHQITNEIQSELRQSVILEGNRVPETQSVEQMDPMSFEYDPYAEMPEMPDTSEMPDRPPTAASTDTNHKMGVLWHDFDGTHCPETVPEEPEPPQASGSRQSSHTKAAPDPGPQGAPPPDDGMVFYPAPVPRMLNLPQRLSKQPAANVQARRRTQLLESMQADNRKSGAWPTEAGAEQPKPNRKSRQSLAGLPPQLRASAFFDQPASSQEYEVKGESAEETLENILEASTHAPVSAFTDHTFVGPVGDDVYGKEHKRKESKADAIETPTEGVKEKRRSAINLLDLRFGSGGKKLNKLKKRNSSADLNMLTIRAAESRMSLGDDLEHHDPDARGPGNPDQNTSKARSFDGEDHYDGREVGEEEEQYEEEMSFGPPTTLLAELQLRKMQNKNRNKAAANAFPNGMHSTLLQLDAVAEIEWKKRKAQKVSLAWEAQPQATNDADSDDDVPLGILFPGRDGLVNKQTNTNAQQQQQSDWDRPLGLIAQRELEDSEPLSRRRNRLVGNRMTRDLDPSKRHTQFSQSQSHLAVPTPTTPQPESEEDEGETLAQRMRRMKDRQALDDALGDVRKSVLSNDFAAEMMSQFGVQEEKKAEPAASPANGEEEETLGQRRARLQAEAMARGDANPHGNRPPLRTSMSMADVLGAHPMNPNNHARKVSDEALMTALPQGSLLRQSAEKQEKMRASRIDINRMSSYGGLNQPLLGNGVGKKTDDLPISANIQAYKNKISGAPTPMVAPQSMMFNGQMVPGVTPAMSGVNLPGQHDSFFPQQPGMGMVGMNGMGMMNPQIPQMNTMNMNMGMMGVPGGMGYPQVGGIRHSTMMNVPSMPMAGMGLQQQMMMEPPMDPKQRAVIDRWRESVMH